MRKRSPVSRASKAHFASTRRRPPKRRIWSLEHLEPRLNMAPIAGGDDPGGGGTPPPPPPGPVVTTLNAGGTPATSFPASLMRDAYHMDEMMFPNGVVGNGAGQTIAIIVAQHWDKVIDDVNQFSAQP